MKYDASDYNVIVQRVKVDGEITFRARVREFPDVDVYEDSADIAYANAITAVGEIIKLTEELKHAVPDPFIEPAEDFSGRVTLRMPRSLHQNVSAISDREGVSLNQYIVTVLATAAARSSFSNMQIAPLNESIGIGENFAEIAKFWRIADGNSKAVTAQVERAHSHKKLSGYVVTTKLMRPMLLSQDYDEPQMRKLVASGAMALAARKVY